MRMPWKIKSRRVLQQPLRAGGGGVREVQRAPPGRTRSHNMTCIRKSEDAGAYYNNSDGSKQENKFSV